MKNIKLAVAFLVCGFALLLPYRVRVYYYQIVAFVVHLPFKIFGILAKWLMKQVDWTSPYE